MENSALNLAFFSLAAALGALARYGLSAAVGAILGTAFPWGIFVTNVLGCFLFGMAWALTDLLRIFPSAAAHTIVLTGFLGAFTTFSTYIFDSRVLLDSGQWLALAGNMLGQLAVGLPMLYLGVKLTVFVHGLVTG